MLRELARLQVVAGCHLGYGEVPPEVDHHLGGVSAYSSRGRVSSFASIPMLMRRSRANIYFRMYNEVRRLPPVPIPGHVVLLVLDLAGFVAPDVYGMPDDARATRSSLRRSSLIVFISETVRSEFHARFAFDQERTIVAQGALPERLRATSRPLRSPGHGVGGAHVVLLINPSGPNKNWHQALAACSQLLREGTSLRLWVVGSLGGEEDALRSHLQGDPTLSDATTIYGRVSDAELARLYPQATAVIVPSFYEGFGMPLIEAMSFEAPLAVSDIPVFREVAQDAALFFPVSDVGATAKVLARLLHDNALCSDLAAAGRRRVAEFSWESSALTLVERLSKLS
jgi:glycosyltransferase involved in cell wall biosynthesis